jgi:hypothetical protein
MLSAFGWIFLLQAIYIQIDTVKGRSDYYMQYQIIDKVLIVISIALTYSMGIKALIIGQLFATIVSYFVSVWYLKKVVVISVRTLLTDIVPFFVASLLMYGLSFYALNFFSGDILQILFVCVFSPLVYFLLLKVLKVEEANMVVEMVKTGVLNKMFKKV